MSRRVRAGGALGHLLLVAVLTFGIFAMHTMGHPEESSGAAMSTASHASAADTGAQATPHAGASAHTDSSTEASSHESGMAMDMASLCVAVLFGAWVLAALLKSAFARHQEWLARLRAQVGAVQRPNPPPRGPDLTQLSVLRL